ncbi:MAG: hypothetical protein J0I82_16420 [Spirosoma sp.]|nr:hypothetical protein [Spirosoma sp.]
MILVIAACSRPVAYFQPSQREHFSAKTTSETTSPITTPVTTEATDQQVVVTPAEQLAQTNSALDKVDALVRNDSKLAENKSVQKRLNRIRTMLAAQPTDRQTTTAVTAPKKMNLVERMMVKKMNKKISRQLAPANPDKTMMNSGTLATGAVLVLIGLLLLLLTTGTGATIGVIALIVGAVLLLVGLL